MISLQVACAVVHLLLEYGANPDLLCEGHSALSLAICSGNDLVRHHSVIVINKLTLLNKDGTQ